MPKQAKLEIQTKVSASGQKQYWFTVPASLSPTGKRTRPQFERKKLAELERERILAMNRRYGHEATKVPAEVLADAARALDVLSGHETSLTAIAKEYVARKDAEMRSRTFREVWNLRMDSLIGRSDNYISQLNSIGNKLLPEIGDKLVCNLKHGELRELFGKYFQSPHCYNNALRSISPFFEWAVSEQWANENPCKRIRQRETGRTEIQILNLNQCRKLMMSCQNYQQDKSMPPNLRVDTRGALAAVAIALFSGVRPGGEISRLEWKDVDMLEGTIFISNQKAKTDRSRFFTMPDTLKAWLDTIPVTERHGSICTANWKRTWQAVRKAAGIGDLRDATRKTFATMHLAHFKDVNLTRSIMGHEAGDVLFQNYRGLATPKDAARFWEILPSDNNEKVEKVS